jgi:hypothetical protein
MMRKLFTLFFIFCFTVASLFATDDVDVEISDTQISL